MPNFTEITSKDNPLIKLVSGLQTSAKQRKSNGLFVLEGLRICEDAYENNIMFDKLIVTKSAIEKHSDIIEKFSKSSEKCYILREDLFKKISDTNSPQGIIAVAKIPKILSKITNNGRYIALENLSDPSNLGAIARTAEALGVDGIIMTSDSCDPYSPKSLRSSMGTLLRLPLFIVEDISDFIFSNNLTAYACVVDKDADSITETNFADGDVLLIGNEANGLTDTAKTVAKKCLTIKMSGKAESLNAAVAAAIAMWEMVKDS
ncbi:MAG: RNA methyltransferase [Clostridia bacterium]|nr:RNA methyltransferase [Clostridia bacterium]